MWSCALYLLQAPIAPSFENSLEPLIEAHCTECHSGARAEGELDLKAWTSDSASLEASAMRESLERVRDRLLRGEMPPANRPRPDEAALDRAFAWLDGQLPREALERPSLRRLNRSEYERTVLDLLSVSFPTREHFPADDVGAMFDNDAASAGASELCVERWVEAAERIAALALPAIVESRTQTFAPAELQSEGGVTRRDGELSIYSSGKVNARCEFPRDGLYRIEVIAFGDLAGDELPRLSLEVDGRPLGERDLHAERGRTETLAASGRLERGEREVSARFVNDYYAPLYPDPKRRDRNAHIVRLAVVGPLDPQPATAFTEWLDTALAEGSLESALSRLGLRVWRRPLDGAELERLCSLAKSSASPRDGIRTALVALLASPNFLYRIESSVSGSDLSGFELATRLSYFLWASAPDQRLLELAARGELRSAQVRSGEIRRLLRDARSRSLAGEFAAQWLGWRALEQATPDSNTFPDADEALLTSMRQESEAFFEAMLREDRPLDEFLDADFTFVDERLARLYGIEGIRGEGLRRVRWNDRERGGLLGQAAILTATSNPTRTSPVKRGKWVLENLLDSHVPPPPPGVGSLAEPSSHAAPRTLREQLELHRTSADCSSCHARLDPIGFALEGFDAIGRRRAFDADGPIDCRGILADGTEINGLGELKQYVQQHGSFAQALARALFLYAMGRAPTRGEERELKQAVAAIPAPQRTLGSVIEVVCSQSAFLRAGVP
ncbi:MAG TPA: DUF1592 domain-containing protein [Planctomycetota bacterium]|nr:DUF1592 domain-containing protein [Planctomycetota bacterium]